eukprot:scaffold4247_cov60-Phaeocystis_antarctica.AAC.1
MPRRGASATLRRRMGRRTGHGGGHRVRTGFLAARRGPRCLGTPSSVRLPCERWGSWLHEAGPGLGLGRLGWCGGRELECDVKPH